MKPSDNIRRRFIAAESDTLIVETMQEESLSSREHLRLVKLKGTWRANEYNELCFEVSLRKGPPETITFKGTWKLNDNQQIKYTNEDGRDTLTFKGYWQISSANRIAYILEGSSTSRFEFKVQLESPVLYPKKGEIRYRIGIGIRQSRLTVPGQMLILYGEWKFGRKVGLIFKMEYEKGEVHSVNFGAKVNLSKQDEMIFDITDEKGKPLGFSLKFSHRFLKELDASVFTRIKAAHNEYGADIGVKIPF